MRASTCFRILVLAITSLSLFACSPSDDGPEDPTDSGGSENNNGAGIQPPNPNPNSNQNPILKDFVVKARFTAAISSKDGLSTSAVSGGSSATTPITVIVAPDAEMAVSISEFTIPPITNSVLDFGRIKISALKDNNLKVCGSDGKSRCGSAIIRMYTTGVAGAGIYNTAGGYGAPIAAGLTGAASQTVGLEPINAIVLQTHQIPSNRNVLHLSDLAVAPVYGIKSDFTNAGAGTYATQLVIEYGLIP